MRDRADFYPGLDIVMRNRPLGFAYGEGVDGPAAELRKLDAIRGSLRDPACSGPEIVYAIAMDVAKREHKRMLAERMLLFGVVVYASGRLGKEPVRSQGHVHKVSRHSGWSPPEVYEIWTGSAFVYMQEYAAADPGRCFAVYAEPGDVVVVPPGWAHATISADPDCPLAFGAWCNRESGFEYDEVRKRQGLAWYPLLSDNGGIEWGRNGSYAPSELVVKRPNDYTGLGIAKDKPIYAQFEENPDTFLFVSEPKLKEEQWLYFVP